MRPLFNAGAALALLAGGASGFYLPGVAPKEYSEGDKVEIKARPARPRAASARRASPRPRELARRSRADAGRDASRRAARRARRSTS